jgi:hypothetical protein
VKPQELWHLPSRAAGAETITCFRLGKWDMSVFRTLKGKF